MTAQSIRRLCGGARLDFRLDVGKMRGGDHVVLVTGAEGRIGSGFRDEYLTRYADLYRLRLAVADRDFADSRFEDHVFVRLEDLKGLEEACRGVRTVVHLAANAAWRADFRDLLTPNVVGTYHVFEAARRMGCQRVVYASSVHAVMANPVDRQAHQHDPARPDTVYGATKVFGESLCSVFAHLHGLSCIALRIGAYVSEGSRHKVERSANPQFLDMVVTQRDLSQLINRCVMAPEDLRYAVLGAVSDNRFKRMDIQPARDLVGYAPVDDAFRMSKVVRLEGDDKV